MDESLFVECARWIYEHKTGVDWWTPYVLTEHNPNPNPHYGGYGIMSGCYYYFFLAP